MSGGLVWPPPNRRTHISLRLRLPLPSRSNAAKLFANGPTASDSSMLPLPLASDRALQRPQRCPVRRLHQVPGHVFMRDECGRLGEHLAAGGVVVVRVAVDDIPDRYVETAVELALQPRRSVRVGRIHEDDALRGVEEHPIVAHVTESIEVAGQVNDLPARRSRWRPLAELGLRNVWAHQQHRHRSHQKARS